MWLYWSLSAEQSRLHCFRFTWKIMPLIWRLRVRHLCHVFHVLGQCIIDSCGKQTLFSWLQAISAYQMELWEQTSSYNYRQSYVFLLGCLFRWITSVLQLQTRLQSSSIEAFKTSQISVSKAEVSTVKSTKKKRRDTSDVTAHPLGDSGAHSGDKLVSITCQQSFPGKKSFICTKRYQGLLRYILSSIPIPISICK